MPKVTEPAENEHTPLEWVPGECPPSRPQQDKCQRKFREAHSLPEKRKPGGFFLALQSSQEIRFYPNKERVSWKQLTPLIPKTQAMRETILNLKWGRERPVHSNLQGQTRGKGSNPDPRAGESKD